MLAKGTRFEKIEYYFDLLSKILASIGGLILILSACITIISIIGRSLVSIGLKPITGEFELVEMACAIAVFFFMPYCQMQKGHMRVDLFISMFSKKWQDLTTLLGDVLICLFAIIITERLWHGFWAKYQTLETTIILGIPRWYGYLVCLIGAGIFAGVALFTVWRDLHHFKKQSAIS